MLYIKPIDPLLISLARAPLCTLSESLFWKRSVTVSLWIPHEKFTLFWLPSSIIPGLANPMENTGTNQTLASLVSQFVGLSNQTCRRVKLHADIKMSNQNRSFRSVKDPLVCFIGCISIGVNKNFFSSFDNVQQMLLTTVCYTIRVGGKN